MNPIPAKFASPLLLALLLSTGISTVANADSAPGSDLATAIIPAGTKLHFHLSSPLGSDTSKTGETFHFVLTDPIDVNGSMISPSGTVGSGTVFLSGHAGTSGHEGDLTLRLDSLPAADGRQITFADQRLAINGRNRKIMSSVLGFIPYAGFGAMFLRGSDIRISAETPIETVLLRPAAVGVIPSDAPSPLPSPLPPPLPSPSPSTSPA
jgi:hypothetical protein